MKKNGIKLIDFGVENPAFENILHLVNQLINAFGKCLPSCLKASYTRYFNDTSRFDIDSPYHCFDDILYNPKLLSNASQAALATNETLCDANEHCKNYDVSQQNLVDILLDTVNLEDYDALMLPSSTILPYIHNETLPPRNIITLFFLSTMTRLPGLNVPSWFSEKEGLPVGILLVSKPDRFDNTLKIASLIEKSKRLDTLPKSTPLLRDLDCNKNDSIKLQFKTGILLIYFIFLYFCFDINFL